MSTKMKSILVTGATGKQGGSLINHLLKSSSPAAQNIEILAVTRDANSPSAQRLASKSPHKIRLVTGNMSNTPALFQSALKASTTGSIYGAFSVQAVQPGSKKGSEESQGKAMIDAALANNVQHFVYASVERGGPEKSPQNPTNIPHFRSKHNIEQHLFRQTQIQTQTQTAEGGSKMKYTILRPVAFFENLTPDFFGRVFSSAFSLSLSRSSSSSSQNDKGEKPLQLIAASDIGFFAAEAFLNPTSPIYSNQSLSLAGEELTFSQYREIFGKVTGKPLPLSYAFVTRIVLWMVEELGSMFRWFREEGFGADVEWNRGVFPGIKGFEGWLREESQFSSSSSSSSSMKK